MKTGIYQIKNLVNNKIYIGSVAFKKGFVGRWSSHCTKLRKNKHHSIHLQHAWNKYGEDAFVFEILEECQPEKCIKREQHYLDTVLFANCQDNRFYRLGYNICRIAGSSLGRKHSNEAKAKMSAFHKGKPSPRRGQKTPRKTRIKISIAMLGKQNCLGVKHSKKSRANMSQAHQGELSHRAKLTESDVHQIRILRKQGFTQKVVAERFQVSRSTINHIDSDRTWSHI